MSDATVAGTAIPLLGVRHPEDLPDAGDMPPASERCCHGCGRNRARLWVRTCLDDLSWWQLPLCVRCTKIGLGMVGWESLTDGNERRWADRVLRYVENFHDYASLHHREWTADPPFRGGIFADRSRFDVHEGG